MQLANFRIGNYKCRKIKQTELRLAATEEGMVCGDRRLKLEENNKLLYLMWIYQNNVPIVGVITVSNEALLCETLSALTYTHTLKCF